MPDILNVDPLQKFMCMAVGANGSGKSIAISSWRQKGSVYFFDFDGRMASVANWARQRGLKAGQLTYDTYGVDNLYESLVKLDKFVDNCPHGAIAIDSFTAVTVTAVMYSLRKREGSGEKAKLASRSKGDLIIPDWDEYKGETVVVTQMLDLCKAIASKGTAVFWTAHPLQSTKISGKEYSIQTRYTAYGQKTDSLIPIYFNEIYNFVSEWDPTSGNIERKALTQPMAGVNAKTALNVPKEIVWTNKDFYPIFTQLVQEGQEEADRRGEVYRKLNPEPENTLVNEFLPKSK